jgi:cytochrome c553
VRLAGLVAAAALAAASPAAAQDAARGQALAAERRCFACHGEGGRSGLAGVPSLAGQLPDFITIQMILFREGLRQAPAMSAAAADMADRDIEDIAAHFARLPAGPAEDRRARDAALFARGEALIGPRHCGVCHLADFRGRNQVPRLTGQREDFLAATLKAYRDGTRSGPDTQMNGAVAGLSDADLDAIAHYLAQLD